MKYTTDSYIGRCKYIHNDKYDYTLVEYNGSFSSIKITCKEHGVFEHLNGQGCPKCNTSKGENIIESILIEKRVNYIKNYKFDDCKYKKSLPFDFYLPDYNLCVEYDGIQHFEVIDFFGGKEKFDYRKNNDSIKNKYCISKNIILSRISYKDDILNKIEQILWKLKYQK